SGPSALNVVNIEYRIFGLPAAVLTNVSVPEKHVFPHVPKSELFALLVRRSGNVRVLQQLRIKRRGFDGYSSHRQDPHDRFYARQVSSNAVFHRRSKPAFVLACHPIVETRRTVARLAAAARAAQGKTGRQKIRDVL